jgi:hypothetical protein
MGVGGLLGKAYFGHKIPLSIQYGTIAGGGRGLEFLEDVRPPSVVFVRDGGIEVGGVPIDINLAGVGGNGRGLGVTIGKGADKVFSAHLSEWVRSWWVTD